MATETRHQLALRNAELSTRVEELTKQLAHCEALSQLAAGTVHDLRNVFQVALLASDTLLQTLQRSDELELVQTIRAAAEHGTLLSQDLLSVARKPQTRACPCAELLPRIQRLIERIAYGRCECSLETTQSLHAISVDPAQLEAALLNIGVNARDAMAHGGHLQISVKNLPDDAPVPSGLAPGGYVQFAITDNGPGMPPDVLARATEAFFTTKAARGGTGLGLAMAHAFAMRSGGLLLIDSQLGQGTCVRLILPGTARPAPQPNPVVDKIMHRVRSPELQRALTAWHAACPPDGLPLPASVEARLTDHEADSIALCVIPGSSPRALRLLRVGTALAAALDLQPLTELKLDGTTDLGTLAAAYRRALLSRSPSYELASYTLADGVTSTFERLILPAAADGEHVSHLIGVIRCEGALQQPQKGLHGHA